MGVQSTFFDIGTIPARTFASSKTIASKSHVAVFIQSAPAGSYVIVNSTQWELINNSVVFPDNVIGNGLEVRVADSPDELETSPSDISIVASIATEVSTVSGIASSVSKVAPISTDVTKVAAVDLDVAAISPYINDVHSTGQNIVDVSAVATDIADVVTCSNNIAAIIDAPNQAASASSSASSAAASFISFDKRYLGAKTSDPSLDNQGVALANGAMYFNTVSGLMRVYDGVSWIDVPLYTAADILANILTVDGTGSLLNSDFLRDKTLSALADFFNVIAHIDASGIMEIGKRIDFHETANDASDYSSRIESVAGLLYGNGFPLLTEKSKLIASTGYLELGNGLILQAGSQSIAANSIVTVTYPLAFPNATMGVVVTGVYNQLAISDNYFVNNVAAASFQIVNGPGVTIPYQWFAIGY